MKTTEKPEFNQENVNKVIEQIKCQPEKDREKVAREVKKDIRAWLLHTFTFSKAYEKRMAHWPQSLREETGFGIGTALQYDSWKLEIKFPENPEPKESKTKHEQTVKGEADPINGGYTVTKSHTWSW